MAYGIHLGILLVCSVAEHVCFGRQSVNGFNSLRHNDNTYVGFSQNVEETQLGHSQNWFRQAPIAPSYDQNEDFHRENSLRSSYNQRQANRGDAQTLSQPAQNAYAPSSNAYPGMASQSTYGVAPVHSPSQDTYQMTPLRPFGLSTSIGSGSTISSTSAVQGTKSLSSGTSSYSNAQMDSYRGGLSPRKTAHDGQGLTPADDKTPKTVYPPSIGNVRLSPQLFTKAVYGLSQTTALNKNHQFQAESKPTSKKAQSFNSYKQEMGFSSSPSKKAGHVKQSSSLARLPGHGVPQLHVYPQKLSPRAFSATNGQRAMGFNPQNFQSVKPIKRNFLPFNGGGSAQHQYKTTVPDTVQEKMVPNMDLASQNPEQSAGLTYNPTYSTGQMMKAGFGPRPSLHRKPTTGADNSAVSHHQNKPSSPSAETSGPFSATVVLEIPDVYGGSPIRRLKSPARKTANARPQPAQSHVTIAPAPTRPTSSTTSRNGLFGLPAPVPTPVSTWKRVKPGQSF